MDAAMFELSELVRRWQFASEDLSARYNDFVFPECPPCPA
jgi:hypothetical protein